MKHLIILCCIVFISSCSDKLRTVSTKTTDVFSTGILHKPVVADLEVENAKIEGQADMTDDTNIDVIKQEAVFNALKKVNADLLVEPRYISETYRGRTTVTVTGYPATYKNFRPMVDADTTTIKAGILHMPETVDPSTKIQKKKSAVATVLILTALAIAGGVIAATSDK